MQPLEIDSLKNEDCSGLTFLRTEVCISYSLKNNTIKQYSMWSVGAPDLLGWVVCCCLREEKRDNSIRKKKYFIVLCLTEV